MSEKYFSRMKSIIVVCVEDVAKIFIKLYEGSLVVVVNVIHP